MLGPTQRIVVRIMEFLRCCANLLSTVDVAALHIISAVVDQIRALAHYCSYTASRIETKYNGVLKCRVACAYC